MRLSFRPRYPWPKFPRPAVIAMIAGLLVYGFFVVLFLDLPGDKCLFKAITHIPCPTCGSSRAVLALTRGDILDALRMNAFFIISSFIVLVILLLRLVFRIKISLEATTKEKIFIAVVCAALFIGNWIFLIIDKR
ncbi:MAG: DUF2752 domain-containing protein [Spirochaetales bacterium]|nr:DUF2752 domain-containing protein [Spirochaetales bacterium]